MRDKAQLREARERRRREVELEQERIEWVEDVQARLEEDRGWFESRAQELTSKELALLDIFLRGDDVPCYRCPEALSPAFALTALVETVEAWEDLFTVDPPFDYKTATIAELVKYKDDLLSEPFEVQITVPVPWKGC